MATVKTNPPLLVIVGETASGKSALAMTLAKEFNGEIIAGDARTIYRGMDIGTAKPSRQAQQQVRHHLIDELEIDQPITAAMFKDRALQAISEITARGKLPILVGGSGLYVDSVLFDYGFNLPVDTAERQRLQQLTVPELQAELRRRGIALPQNHQNPRHLIRALETAGRTPSKGSLRANTLIVGTMTERTLLRQKIIERVDAMFAAGLEAELRGLVKKHGWNGQLSQTIGYKEFKDYLSGEQSLEAVRAAIIRDTVAYAKRQRTWFRRNGAVKYPCNIDEVVALVTTWLNK